MCGNEKLQLAWCCWLLTCLRSGQIRLSDLFIFYWLSWKEEKFSTKKVFFPSFSQFFLLLLFFGTMPAIIDFKLAQTSSNGTLNVNSFNIIVQHGEILHIYFSFFCEPVCKWTCSGMLMQVSWESRIWKGGVLEWSYCSFRFHLLRSYSEEYRFDFVACRWKSTWNFQPDSATLNYIFIQ